ncbi:MAG: hypothetical protein JWN16_2611 [Alphaproteobacteria bacterium]|nr:hypothetical protein [Alphaproteobacteria bacterium]
MTVFTGSTEIQILLWAIILGLVQLMLATTMATRELGTKWNASPRDAPTPPVSTVTGRMLRAFANFKETFVFFAVAVLVVTVLGKHSATSALGAQLYFWARLAYVPVYAAGIPVLRSLIWLVSLAGIVMVLVAALA